MSTDLNNALNAFIDAQLASSPGATNHDIYEKRLTANPIIPKFEAVPHCIYFYYVRIDHNGKVRVDHYFYVKRNAAGESQEIPHADVPGIIYNLAINAMPRTSNKNPPRETDSYNFNNFDWYFRAYIAIFFDEVNWAFAKRTDGLSAIVFDQDKGKANNSFFDGTDVVLDIPRARTPSITDKRSAVYFVNHVKKNSDGDDLEVDARQDFKFDMWLTATFANSSETGMRVNFDPGGTNQGPPQDPP